MNYRGNAAMDGSKKEKMVWRPISTHSSSVFVVAGYVGSFDVMSRLGLISYIIASHV